MNIGIIGISLKGICKMKTVVEKLENLRNKMKANNVQAYIICTEDYHGSEYAGDYFKEREYMSGFTGSAGTLVILYDEAALWTDGRYFLQAEDELSGSTIKLMKMFQTGVPAIEEYLYDKLSDSDRIGFDGRTLTTAFAEKIYNKVSSKNITFKVTSGELLKLTNGIVQGMSGSPIIQNGKIIGAVTHVFVDDSTCGYGIFIDRMLDKD